MSAVKAGVGTDDATNEDKMIKYIEVAKRYLQYTYKDDLLKNLIDSASCNFIIDTADLNNDGIKEVFAGLSGPYFCGSGGCTAILLDQEGKLITRFTVTDFPILISPAKTAGWHNLLISSRGQYHRMFFEKGRYPSNPSVQPLANNAVYKKAKRVLDNKQSYEW